MSLPMYGEESFCDINSSDEEAQLWVRGEDKMFTDFPGRFIHKDIDGSEWISLYIYQENKLRPENDEYSVSGFPRGEQHIWTIATMYILPNKKSKCIEKDLAEAGFASSSNGMQSCYSLYSREYAWSPGYASEFVRSDEEEDEAGLKAFSAAVNFMWEEEYDASQEEASSFAIPAGQIIQEMHLYEKNVDGVFYRDEEIVALDLALVGNEHTEIVIRRDVFDEYITKTGAQAFWTVIGEKQYFMGDINQKWQRREGYFIYDKKKIVGSISLINNH